MSTLNDITARLTDALLAANGDYSMQCFLESSDKLGCVINGATAATRGAGIFAVLFVGAVLTTNYLAGNQSLATPSVLVILLSGLIFTYLPGQFAQLGLSMVIIGVAGAFWVIGRKFLLSPGTY